MDIFYSVLKLLTGIGIFLIGIVMFSECLEKNASKGVRKLFNKISNNRFAGVGVGAGSTAIIQSSSATTVMVVGLVNAGILTLFQATAIIMGANIGTTITAFLVSFSSFKIKEIFMTAALVGAMLKLVTKKEKFARIADLLISFGILFVGLELMSGAFTDKFVSIGKVDGIEQFQLVANPLKVFFGKLFEKSLNIPLYPIMLLVLGAVFTALIQSSSASTAIFLIMVKDNVLPFGGAIYLVLGANIGTCITAFLASLTANTNAKRAAMIHILFNIFGAVLFTALLWPLGGRIIPWYQGIFERMFDKFETANMWALSAFHLFFNTTMMLVLIGFIKPFNKLVCLIVKEKPDDKSILRVKYIDERLLATPVIALEYTKKEILDMANIARANLELAFKALIEHDLSKKEEILQEEQRINFLNQQLARYLVKLSATSVSLTDEKLIGGFHHVINDIERIGDHAKNFYEDAAQMKEKELFFSDCAIDDLRAMYGKVSEIFGLSTDIFKNRNPSKLMQVSILEEEVDLMKNSLTDSHITRLNAGECTFEGGEHFYSVVMGLERVADHLTNIAFTVRSYTGSEKEVTANTQLKKEPIKK